ncbi:Pre-mRNA-splicing factor syf2 [Bienertia sinuspersici]
MILSFFLSAKSLFILGNLIIIFLLGESKIQSSDSSSWPRKIVARKVKEKKEKENVKKKMLPAPKFECIKESEANKVVMEMKEIPCQVEEEKEYGFDKEEIYEDFDIGNEELILELSADELNRRADDFIARVNKQIRFEADHEMLLCCY